MEELDVLQAASLDKYFKALSRRGYINNNKTYGLLALCALVHILEDYTECLTEEDLRTMGNVLYCIGGTCLIDFPAGTTGYGLFHKLNTAITLRISEDSIPRNSEDSLFRAKETN